MSIILRSPNAEDVTVNVWNWGVLHHFVAEAELFSDEVWVPARYNGGAELDAEQVEQLADYLEQRLLPCVGEGERIFFDGSVTRVPDDGKLYRDEADAWKNYSLHRDVLVEVIGFLRKARGPVEFW